MGRPIPESDPFIVSTMAAMRRARQIARDTGTPLVVVRNGKVVQVKLASKRVTVHESAESEENGQGRHAS